MIRIPYTGQTTMARLLLFFVLVFVVSWGAILGIAGPAGFPIREEEAIMMGMAILLGPSMASVILLAISGYSELKYTFSRLFKWRIGLGWYAIALLVAPLSTGITLGLFSIFSPEFQPNILLTPDKTNVVLSAMVAGIIVGLFEEIGWTGYATEKLLKTNGIVGTGLIIGILWGAWHFPLFWQENSFSASLPFSLLIARLFSWLPPYRILLVWVYKNTKSLFIVTLMHASLVATLMILDPPMEDENLFKFILARAVLLWVIASGVIAFIRKKS